MHSMGGLPWSATSRTLDQRTSQQPISRQSLRLPATKTKFALPQILAVHNDEALPRSTRTRSRRSTKRLLSATPESTEYCPVPAVPCCHHTVASWSSDPDSATFAEARHWRSTAGLQHPADPERHCFSLSMERGFRTRASSVLQPSSGSTGASGQTNPSRGRKLSGATDTPDIEPFATEKRQCDVGLGVQNKAPSFSSNDKTIASSGENAAAHDRDAQRAVRTIPCKLFPPL